MTDQGSGNVDSFFVYLVRCADGTLYVGRTADLEARVATHNTGNGAAYTRTRRPVRLVYSESFEHETEAVSREAQLKTWSRVKKEALIAGDLYSLHEAAKRRSGR